MSDVAIRVENLSKQFVLGERIGVKTFRESLQDALTAPFRRWVKGDGQAVAEKVDTDREIWALKDVSFEVKHGEVLGIIGPNGAGKSTLLKILSRITEPSGGYAEIRGRVGSLLEVGTGFHPELTGRENVYLNGSILGMSKSEIRRKFDDIVSFAGVEKFIDTPVKRYSSGMQVRLAFAVAAHLEPEILIIDEVLAVGDAEFQKRCLGKMDEVSRSGRTILFVSHNMAAVENLCQRVLLLCAGAVITDSPTSEAISQYLRSRGQSNVDLSDSSFRSKYFRCATIVDSTGHARTTFRTGESFTVRIRLSDSLQLADARLAILLFNSSGTLVTKCYSWHQCAKPIRLRGGAVVECTIPDAPLAPDTYILSLILDAASKRLEVVDNAISFNVVAADIYKTGRLPAFRSGVVLLPATWNIHLS